MGGLLRRRDALEARGGRARARAPRPILHSSYGSGGRLGPTS